jgi:hypothetical protein
MSSDLGFCKDSPGLQTSGSGIEALVWRPCQGLSCCLEPMGEAPLLSIRDVGFPTFKKRAAARLSIPHLENVS